MSSKKEFLTELVRANELNTDEDVFSKELGGRRMAFITRTGIEKIQYQNNITVRFEVVVMQPNYAVIKATATKGDIVVESFGESTPENTKQKPPYHSAMAEKRGLSRVVLKAIGAYKYGVFGEDEADDFKK
jgi:hypothetical protein